MDKTYVQCAQAGALHLETRRRDDAWDWFVQDPSNNTRIGSGCAPSMEKAKEQAEAIVGCKPDWYCLPLEQKPAPVTS
jgi:hypothetical protein